MRLHSPTSERQSFSLEQLVKSYGIPYFEIENGYDLLAVKYESLEAIRLVREERIPVFLKIKTARYKEHVGPGEDFHAGYRSEELMDSWKALDPLTTDHELLREFSEEITNEIEEAVEFGMASPLPTKEDLVSDV